MKRYEGDVSINIFQRGLFGKISITGQH